MKRYLDNVCLLVNNNLLDQEVFARVLRDVSPEITYCVATSGDEAWALITEEKITPDIIFIEAEAPGIHAIEFLKLLRSDPMYRNIPVIVHSKSHDKKKIKKMKKAGATAIYPKEYQYKGVLNIFFIYHLPELILLQLN
jgi:CheY-like chemotaxis protein